MADKNILWGVAWFFITLLALYPAGMCGGIYVLFYTFEACIPGLKVSKSNKFELKNKSI